MSSAAVEAWKASLVPGHTVPLEWEYAPITDFIPDPIIKKSVVAAMNAYIKEQQDAWADLDKCPPPDSQNRNCSGSGTCTKGATRCTSLVLGVPIGVPIGII